MSADPYLDFARASQGVICRREYLLSRATSFAECQRALESDSILADLTAEAGRCWKLLPKAAKDCVQNPNGKGILMRNLKGSTAALAALVLILVGAFGVAAAFRAYMVSLQ